MIGLRLGLSLPQLPFVDEEEGLVQGVQRLTFVELHLNLPAIVLAFQTAQDEDGAAHPPILLQRTTHGILPWCRLHPWDQQRGWHPAELEGGGGTSRASLCSTINFWLIVRSSNSSKVGVYCVRSIR